MDQTDNASCGLMGQALRQVFDDEASEALLGTGAERALAAYESLVASGSRPVLYLEFPLIGPASYDVFVGPYNDGARPGSHLGEACPEACRAAWDWLCKARSDPMQDVLFELDADAPGGNHAGVYCRHFADLSLAEGFLRSMGEGWRWPQYASVVGKLPEGWLPVFCAVFFDRLGAPMRLEAYPDIEARARIARDAGHLATCLEGLGFSAFNGDMLSRARATVAIGRPVSLQFDILSDGSLGPALSVATFLEGAGADGRALCRDGGAVARACGALEHMGLADGRWKALERLIFARKRVSDVDGEQRWVTMLSQPVCAKAKWVDKRPQPAKFYLSLRTVVGEPWALGPWVTPA